MNIQFCFILFNKTYMITARNTRVFKEVACFQHNIKHI